MATADLMKHVEDLVDVDMFYAIVADGRKGDLIDGEIYMASPDSKRANKLNLFLAGMMDMFVQEQKLGGEVYMSRFAFRLSSFDAPEPDVAYVAPDRIELVGEGGMRGAPSIAVEIVAKESRDRDYRLKRELYEQHGVAEYWIVDYLQQRIEFLRLINGAYQLVPLEANRIYRSQALPGFWIDVDWLLANPLPNSKDCLQQILA